MECFNCGHELVKKGKDVFGCPYASCELNKLPMNPRSAFWKRHAPNSYRKHLIEFTKAVIAGGKDVNPVWKAKLALNELGIKESKE